MKANRWIHWGITFLLAVASTLAVYLHWVPYPISSKRALAILALLFAGFFAMNAAFLLRWMLSRFQRLPRWAIGTCIGLSFALSALLIGTRVVPSPDRYFFVPTGTLTIEAESRGNPEATGSTVALTQFETGTTQSFSAFTQTGDWQQEETHLLSETGGSLHWQGSVFHRIKLVFQTGPNAGMARVITDRESFALDLYAPQTGEQILEIPYPSPWVNRALILFADGLSLTFVFLLMLTALTVQPIALTSGTANPHWGRFALPMILGWCLWLLVFFPGLLSPDSTDQWGQAISGQYNDWHPVVYAFLLRAVRFVWDSPAAVGIVQILALSLVTSWGLSVLTGWGLRPAAAWAFSLIFAILPLNGLLTITLWKDIPFAICLFAFMLIFLQIFLSDERWLEPRRNRVALVVCGLGVSLFRHNGFPLVILSGLLFLLILRRSRHRFLTLFLIILALTIAIKGPLYEQIGIQKAGVTGANQLLLHHISAHVAAGTPLSAEDSTYLKQLLPLDEWMYDPCNVDTLKFIAGLDTELLYANLPRNLAIFRETLWKNPAVNLRHLFDASKMVWQMQPGGCYLYRVPLFQRADGSLQWVQANNFGVQEASLLPRWTRAFYAFYARTASVRWLDALLWRPAFSAYWSLLMVILLALRTRQPRLLEIGLLPLLQFLMMIGLSFAQDMRFQYGQILFGLFTTLFLFLPAGDGLQTWEAIPGNASADDTSQSSRRPPDYTTDN